MCGGGDGIVVKGKVVCVKAAAMVVSVLMVIFGGGGGDVGDGAEG